LTLVLSKQARRRLRNIRRTRVFLNARIASQGTAVPATVIRTITVKR
jgi:hypothetical protein